jgi:hypothetical protein
MKAWEVNPKYVQTYTAVGKTAASTIKKMLKEADLKQTEMGPTEVMLHVVWALDDAGIAGNPSFHGLLTVVE